MYSKLYDKMRFIDRNYSTKGLLNNLIHTVMGGMVLGGLFTACIDEDLSKCGVDYQIVYSLRLETKVRTILEQELNDVMEQGMANRLLPILTSIFVENALDLALDFYTDEGLAHHEQHEVNDSQASFVVYLPAKDYNHFAVANLGAEPVVIQQGERSRDWRLSQLAGDTIDSHAIGLFTTYQSLSVENVSQIFEVEVRMQNASSVLVIDPRGNRVRDITGYIVNTANEFYVMDSLFQYHDNQIVRMNTLEEGSLISLCGVSFPSRQAGVSRNTDSEVGVWKMHVYITLEDGRVTENILDIKRPLQAEDLYITKVAMNSEGVLQSNSSEVGVSVTTDWESGGEYNPEL